MSDKKQESKRRRRITKNSELSAKETKEFSDKMAVSSASMVNNAGKKVNSSNAVNMISSMNSNMNSGCDAFSCVSILFFY